MARPWTNPAPTTYAAAFTLVELLVTMVILSILAGLSLSGLAASRQRAKIDKTKSTIRKLHEIVLPQYESYLSRRIAIPPSLTDRTAMAKYRLTTLRALMVQEMPDQWVDVGSSTTVSPYTGAPQRYAVFKGNVSPVPGVGIYGGAECLYMIVTRGGFDSDAAEIFRTDEINDINQNKAPEFVDGWGRPIGFIRWPSGYDSVIQKQDYSINPDPLDPMKVSGSGPADLDYGLTPLIFSGGPDEALNDPNTGANGYGIQTFGPWLTGGYATTLLTTRQGTPLPGFISDTAAARDNITNHDLVKK